MKTHNNLYEQMISLGNLYLAFNKARKNKTKKRYVVEFEQELVKNLNKLHMELKTQTYDPEPLESFTLKDPKTRKISKSDFRDRVVHHAICNIIEPIFDNIFIYDSCANRIKKGNLFGIKRLDKFIRKVSRNGQLINLAFDNNSVQGYCLKADIKHYFDEVNHDILINIIKKKIIDNKVLWLIKRILSNIPKGGGDTQAN